MKYYDSIMDIVTTPAFESTWIVVGIDDNCDGY